MGKRVLPDAFYYTDENGNDKCILNLIVVAGEKGVGKSTFAAQIAPVAPGDKPRTLVVDLEKSWSNLQKNYAVDIIDFKQILTEKHGNFYTDLQYFEALQEVLDNLDGEGYDVLVVDGFDSQLRTGAHAYVCANEAQFGKPKGSYGGTKGSKFAWGQASSLIAKKFDALKSKFQIVVVVSHVKDQYVNDTVVAKELAVKEDFNGNSDLIIWLYRKVIKTKAGDKTILSGEIKRSRLSAVIWEDANGNKFRTPKTISLLDGKIELGGEGDAFIDRIIYFVENPLVDRVAIDDAERPDKLRIPDEARDLLEMEKLGLQNQAAVNADKQVIATMLMEKYPETYPDSRAIAAIAGQLSLVYDDGRDEFVNKLVEYAKAQPEAS